MFGMNKQHGMTSVENKDPGKSSKNQRTFAFTNPDGTVTKTVTAGTGQNPTPVAAVDVTYEKLPVVGPRQNGPDHVNQSAPGIVHVVGKRDFTIIPRGISRFAQIVEYSQALKMQDNADRITVTTDDTFMKEATSQHNYYRKLHGVGPLTLDPDLCAVAQGWANKLSSWGVKRHSANGFGECIYWKSNGFITGYDPVDTWFVESANFDWTKFDLQEGTNNFTQIIWRNTKKLGIALASGGFGIFVVANYSPPGNLVGRFQENVLVAKGLYPKDVQNSGEGGG